MTKSGRNRSPAASARCAALAGLGLLLVPLWGCPVAPPAGEVGLELVADGLTAPMALEFPPGDSDRLFIVDQTGQIRILAGGTLRAEPFLDLSDAIVTLSPTYDERGLLGLAFHPDYVGNGRFFVAYNAPPGPRTPEGYDSELRISEFRVSDSDADRADADSEVVLLRIQKPQYNHNGGQLAFGADGYLYISVGDGGGGNDTGPGHNPDIGNGQDITTLLGKILRIDVDNVPAGATYGIPPDNPLAAHPGAARPEIWAYGLRNPWRFSFDAGDGERLFVADAGQDLMEEVSIAPRGGNLGWRIREGSLCFDPNDAGEPPATCAETGAAGEPLVGPIIEFPHTSATGVPLATVVIGGYVYRGTALPELVGNYIFGNYTSVATVPDGRLLAAREQVDGTWELREVLVEGGLDRFVLAFGEDADGELYVLTTAFFGPVGTSGQIWRITPR